MEDTELHKMYEDVLEMSDFVAAVCHVGDNPMVIAMEKGGEIVGFNITEEEYVDSIKGDMQYINRIIDHMDKHNIANFVATCIGHGAVVMGLSYTERDLKLYRVGDIDILNDPNYADEKVKALEAHTRSLSTPRTIN